MRRLVMAIGIALLCGISAAAGMMDFAAVDSGWYRQTGDIDSKFLSGNLNYFAGEYPTQVAGLSYEYRNYFVFDLAAFGGGATGATLLLPNRGTNTGAPFNYTLYSVITPASTLAVANPGAGAAIFNDLGDGLTYGGVVIPSDTTDPITVTLNATALAAINGAGGKFVIGGDVSLGGPPSNHYLFVDYPRDSKPMLRLETPIVSDGGAAVPEPGSAGLAMIGGLGVLITAIRRRQA